MTNIYEQLGAVLEGTTQHFASAHSAALAQAIYPWVVGGLVFWLSLQGIQILSGRIQEPVVTIMERAGAIVFLVAIAFGTSVYQVDILNDFDALQNALVSAIPGTQTTPYKAADTALQKGFELASHFSEETPVTGPESFFGWAVGSLIIYAGTVAITLTAAGLIMVAKASLALVLAFGQIAIACLMFPPTRKIFDAFMNTVLNRILTVAVVSAVMGMTLDIFTGVAAGYNPDSSNPLSFAFELLIAVIVCGLLIRGAGGVASELAGGIATAAANPIVAAAKMATAPASGAMRYAMGLTSRTSAVTGQQEIASRAAHVMRGNTALNPAYRQKVSENSQNGWGSANGGSTQKSIPTKSPTERIKEMARKRDGK